MKLTIEDGRDHFYTFDTNRILLLTATDEEQINQVEFSTEENGETVSWTSDVLTGEDGIKYVQVPNEFLNGNYSRLVCYYVTLDSKGEFTRQKEVFRIRARQKPEDYFLTYSERVTFASIKALTEQYKVNASNSADLARRYAEENEDVNVEAGTYSSKHWSIKTDKKFQEIKDYVGSTSNPESALGSIESARASAVSNVKKQETDSIEAVGTYTSNTAIPSVSQYVEGTAKPALKTYGEQQVDSYVNGTVKPELDRYVNSEKKQVLDNYTAEKKADLDTYTETDKKQILDSYTENEKKTELNTHVEGLKGQLDSHTVAKAGELNEYTTGLKSELDGYTTAKEQDISEFTEQKKLEVQGVYQTDLNELKGDLDTERNARIEADTDHSTRLQKVEVASSVNRYEIDNLKAKAEGKLYRTETLEAEAYALDVPSSVAPYAEVQRIGGKSVVWNQLVDGQSLYFNKDTSRTMLKLFGKSVPLNHKVLMYYRMTNPTNDGSSRNLFSIIYSNNENEFEIPDLSNKIEDCEKYVIIDNKQGEMISIYMFIDINASSGTSMTIDINVIDLTKMFGSGNEPTLEECKKIFSADYYPYDAGTIKSFPVKTVKSVGKNLFNQIMATTTINGVTCRNNGDGTYTLNGTAESNCYFTVGDVTVSAYGKYKRVGCPLNGSASKYFLGGGGVENDYGAGCVGDLDKNTVVTFIIAITEGYVCNNLVFKPMLTQDLTATYDDFKPYREPVTLDLSSVTSDLKSAGSVHDEWENGKKTKRIGSHTFTGGENWYVNGSSYQTGVQFGIIKTENWYNKNVVITDANLSTNVSQSTLYSGVDTSGITLGDGGRFVISSSDYANMDTLLKGKTVYFEVNSYEETVPEISNYIKVEEGGTITFESDDAVHMPVPSTDRLVVDLTSTTEETT